MPILNCIMSLNADVLSLCTTVYHCYTLYTVYYWCAFSVYQYYRAVYQCYTVVYHSYASNYQCYIMFYNALQLYTDALPVYTRIITIYILVFHHYEPEITDGQTMSATIPFFRLPMHPWSPTRVPCAKFAKKLTTF